MKEEEEVVEEQEEMVKLSERLHNTNRVFFVFFPVMNLVRGVWW